MRSKRILFVCVFLFLIGWGIQSTVSISALKEKNKELNAKIYEQNQQIVQLEDYAKNQLVVIRYATEQEQKEYEQEIVEMIAKTVWGEARGCNDTQKAAVVWCILNRVDSERFPNDIASVVMQKDQFEGYDEFYPVKEEIVKLVEDVLWRYDYEKNGPFVGSSGRVLPKEYLFFRGDSDNNVNVYRTGNSTKDYWDWSWGTVYND